MQAHTVNNRRTLAERPQDQLIRTITVPLSMKWNFILTQQLQFKWTQEINNTVLLQYHLLLPPSQTSHLD